MVKTHPMLLSLEVHKYVYIVRCTPIFSHKQKGTRVLGILHIQSFISRALIIHTVCIVFPYIFNI